MILLSSFSPARKSSLIFLVRQVVEDSICKCQTTGCHEDDQYKKLLYATKQCTYYSDVQNLIVYSEPIFLGIFTLELACKVAARGFVFAGPHAYLREPVNWLDFVVVVTGLLSAFTAILSTGGEGDNAQLEGLAFFDVLRLMRVFRPLRFSARAFYLHPAGNAMPLLIWPLHD